MRVLITGAAGFLGRHFVWHHLQRGDEVIGIDDLSNEHSYWPLGAYEKWKSNIYGAIKYIKLKQIDIDLFYHFAAPVGGRMKIEQDPLFNAASLEYDTAVIRWLAGLDKKPLLIYPSSSAVYPVIHQDSLAKYPLEESVFTPTDTVWGAPDEAYGFVKMSAELLLWKARAYGLESIILRPFSGYGEGQSQEYPFSTIMRKVVRRDPEITIWGSGQQTRDFIHVDDIVGGTQALIDARFRGPINLATGVGTSMFELVTKATGMEGHSPRIHFDTSKPEGVLHRVGSTKVLDGYYEPVVPLNQGIMRVLDYERTQI
jgi:nucleoside-diphosphate-sugar epimerase